MSSVPGKRLETACIRGWLQRGWEDFMETSGMSIAYAAVFCVLGLVAVVVLLQQGLGLMFFALAGGFMFVAPVLATGYYRVACMLRRGEVPSGDDLVFGFRNNPPGVWAITLLVAVIFLLWTVNAALFHDYFLGGRGVVFLELLKDAEQTQSAVLYLLVSSAVGSFLALSIYAVTVFSIPHLFHQRGGFGAAIALSLRTFFDNLWVMLVWGAVLAGLTFATLLIALPLIIVVFPILAYASYAAYLDTFSIANAEDD